MSRYSKIASKYILSKFHQDTSQGAIYERDWTTIGNVHRLEPGKRPYYGSSGFLFTDSTVPVYKKKRKNGKWVGEYTYEDVKDAQDIVNLISVSSDSENLSDYAYWGSMTELFRGSVEHIIKTFPGRLRSTKKRLNIHHHQPNDNDGVEYWAYANGYILGNPFGLDMHTTEENGEINPDDLLRYIALSWRKYNVEDYEMGRIHSVDSYFVYEDYIEYDCELRYFRLYNIVLFYNKGNFLIIDVYLADGKIVYVYRTKEEPGDVPPGWFDFVINYYTGLNSSNSNDNSPSSDSANNRATDSDVEDLLEDWYVPEDFGICPKPEEIEYYFRNLEGFEWKLLNRRTKPYYMNTFLLPIQMPNGNWRLVRRNYTWPSEGIWIDIESTDYDSFISDMVDLCGIYDNLWCDSIWRCMVHESVKNFDWSYRREYDENDAQDNIEGGNRMKDVMRLLGIIYDKAKRYVDGISLYNKITYDGYNNCPNAQISDRNILQGWDITSTQHMFYWYESAGRVNNYENYVPLPVLPVNVDEESPEFVSVTCAGTLDTLYYKKRMLPVPEISLDDTFFSDDAYYDEDNDEWIPIVTKQTNPWVNNNVYGQMYAEIGFTSVGQGCQTLTEFPYQLFELPVGETYPPYVEVLSNNSKKYYKLLIGDDDMENSEIAENNKDYVNGKWFKPVNKFSVSPATSDILFNRCLNLSSNRILKTKGTKEAIEMAFALFGFGRYDETNQNGDYILEEQYNKFTSKQLDETFYFYEIISEEEAQAYTPVSFTELPKNATENSDECIVVSNQSFDTYYKLNGEYTVSDVIRLLYAHRLTERIYDDYYSGVPMNEIVSGNTHLAVPFFDNKKIYEGNLYYEAKGAWMNTGMQPSPYPWENSETIPYLHILQRISDLFVVNTNDAKNGDIYYVADVSDYYEYTNDIPYYLSNFFKLKDKYNSSMFSSWVNVPIEGPIQNGGNSGVEGVTRMDYLHAKHLNDIIPSILFNNPHVGYDRYDMGSEYKSYMENPYKFSADNYLYDDDFYQNMAKQFTFMYRTSTITNDDKALVTANTIVYDDDSFTINTHDGINEVPTNDKYLMITLVKDGVAINASDPRYRMHLEYMRNVVLKYVAQVIPSTAMLALKNFETPEDISNATVEITVAIEGEGVVYGAGTYLKTSMVTLNAVPSEGYHFVGWRLPGRAIQPPTPNTEVEPQYGSFENTLTVMACEDKEYTAVFAEDCGIAVGCHSTNCHTNPNAD
jgi:hypothetical protein